MLSILAKNKLAVIGVVLGAVGGYLYYHYIGCASGTCAITSKPLNSTAYGAVMGGLLLSIFENNKKISKDESK